MCISLTLSDGGLYHIETSPLICYANHENHERVKAE